MNKNETQTRRVRITKSFFATAIVGAVAGCGGGGSSDTSGSSGGPGAAGSSGGASSPAAASAPDSASSPTPTTSLACPAGNGQGTNGLQFYSPTGQFSYSLSTPAASAQDYATLTWGVKFNNVNNLAPTAYSGSLRATLFAVSSSFTGGNVIQGQVLGVFNPNFTGSGAQSANQIKVGGYSTTTVISSSVEINPPAGQYCIVAALDEYSPSSCSSSDGYCFVDWIQFPGPEIFK